MHASVNTMPELLAVAKENTVKAFEGEKEAEKERGRERESGVEWGFE